MTVYCAALTWKALTELFEIDLEALLAVTLDESGEELLHWLRTRVNLNDAELEYALEALEHMAYEITQVVDDDFSRLLLTVKNSSKIIRDYFSTDNARALIEAFEVSETPELTTPELITGIYLVIRGGERDIPNFVALDSLIELETP